MGTQYTLRRIWAETTRSAFIPAKEANQIMVEASIAIGDVVVAAVLGA